MSDQVLRVTKGDIPLCPECGEVVESYSVAAEEFWTLKPKFQGTVGLPVGPEFGDRHIARTSITLEPCKHEVGSLEISTPPKPPDPLTLIKLDDLYEATSRCERCGTYIGIVEEVDMSLAELVSAAREHLETCDPVEES